MVGKLENHLCQYENELFPKNGKVVGVFQYCLHFWRFSYMVINIVLKWIIKTLIGYKHMLQLCAIESEKALKGNYIQILCYINCVAFSYFKWFHPTVVKRSKNTWNALYLCMACAIKHQNPLWCNKMYADTAVYIGPSKTNLFSALENLFVYKLPSCNENKLWYNPCVFVRFGCYYNR